jgi:apolipoprotein N-acyltransferase
MILKAIGRPVSECSAILAIMHRYPNDSEVQKWACAAIQVCASNSIDNKEQLINEGAHTSVLKAIQLNSEYTADNKVEVVIWSCTALIALLNDSTSNRCILRSTDTGAIINAAQATHHSNTELMAIADELLLKLIPQTPSGSNIGMF